MELKLTVALSPHLTIEELTKLETYCLRKKTDAESLAAFLIRREVLCKKSRKGKTTKPASRTAKKEVKV